MKVKFLTFYEWFNILIGSFFSALLMYGLMHIDTQIGIKCIKLGANGITALCAVYVLRLIYKFIVKKIKNYNYKDD
jgi:hypothetical protein